MWENLLASWRQSGQKQDHCPSLLNHNAKYKRLLPPYCDFANRWAARRRAPSWRGNGARLPCRTDVSPGLDRAVDPISAAVSDRLLDVSFRPLTAQLGPCERRIGMTGVGRKPSVRFRVNEGGKQTPGEV